MPNTTYLYAYRADPNAIKKVEAKAEVAEEEEEEVEDVTMPHIPVVNKIDSPIEAAAVVPIVPVVPISIAADPYVAQRKYAEGSLPDPVTDNPCVGPTKADTKLLNIVSVVPLAESNPKNLKLFCGIYTMASNHQTNVKATIDTWGKKCTGFMAFSTEADPTLPALKIEHEGDEAYDNMWQKSKSIWKYIAEHYINDFDYFLMGGDDMFYIIENLFTYLNSEEIDRLRLAGGGQFIGRRFFPPQQEVFNSGGAGYLLDRAALQILKDNIDTPKCFPHQRGFWEDVNIANCMRVSAKILPYDTRDSLQRERFHPFTPGNHLTYRIPPVTPDWYAKYNPELKIGLDCCSNESVSFHYCPVSLFIVVLLT